MKFEIKNYFTGDVKFTAELSADYNHRPRSMQLGAAVQMAVQAGADLQGADLRGAKLEGAKLEGAKLRLAKLEGADLESADLQGADLTGADLWGAKLEGAKLRLAKLWGADLWSADLWDADLRIYHGIYSVIVTPSHVHIGCERRTPEKWLALTEDVADAIDGEQAVEALRQDGPVIKAMIEQMRPDLVDRQSARLRQERDEAFAAIAQVRGLALHYQNTRPHPVRWKHVQQICDAALDARAVLTDQPSRATGTWASAEDFDHEAADALDDRDAEIARLQRERDDARLGYRRAVEQSARVGNERDEEKRRADALERALRKHDERARKHGPNYHNSALELETRAALTQQPADPVASHKYADLSHNAACVSQDASDQPADALDARDAALREAESADLRGADLRGANLRSADLRDADLRNGFCVRPAKHMEKE